VGSHRGTFRLLIDFLREQGYRHIGEPEWLRIREQFATVAERTLRKHARGTGFALAPLVEGVRQDSFDHLERTLLNLAREYAGAMMEGDRARARECRKLVIKSKDHAKWNLRRAGWPEERRLAAQEKVLWMLTWLEDPGLFAPWIQVRRKAKHGAAPE
jgi:hypothetical protein